MLLGAARGERGVHEGRDAIHDLRGIGLAQVARDAVTDGRLSVGGHEALQLLKPVQNNRDVDHSVRALCGGFDRHQEASVDR